MRPFKLLVSLALLGGLAGTILAPAAPALAKKSRSPYKSRLLWATVDVCGPTDQPHTIGVRGSMPGDERPAQTMYMRFRVQYLDPATHAWKYLPKGADSGFQAVGPADAPGQAGRSFQFVPTPGASYTLRGVVSFQWRRRNRIIFASTLTTTANRRSFAGADPPGYSAATCVLT
jgi:hypothetical protein